MAFDLIINNTYSSGFLMILKDIFIPLVAAGFGAFAGGYFAQKNYMNNVFKIDIQYINYANSILFGLLNSLYCLKKQFIVDDKVQEEMQLIDNLPDESFDEYVGNNNEHYLKKVFNMFSFINQTILCAKYTFPINEENLKIIADINMNIFTEIINCRESLTILNKVIEILNEHIHLAEIDLKYTKHGNGYYKKLHDLRISLHENVDDCIYNVELLIKCLNKSGKLLTKNSKKGTEIFKEIIIPQVEDDLQPVKATKHIQIEKWLEKEK